jgi:hypothetical protein
MKTIVRWLCLSLLGLVTACATLPSGGGRWERLGRRSVDIRADRDVIRVGRSEGRFGALRFIVRGGAIELYDVVVTLGDGNTYRHPSRLLLKRGEGRVIDLPGGRRVVRRVEFMYRTLRSRGRRATVTLYGR